MSCALTTRLEPLAGNMPSHRWALLSMLLIVPLFVASPISGDEGAEVPGGGPGSYRILAEDGVIRFPFEVFRGDIRFLGKINGHEAHLLLDDGFMWDQLALWGGPEVKSLGLEYDGEIFVGGSEDGEGLPSKTASGITISFPGVEFTDQTAIVMPSASGVSTMWRGSIGQVSAMFFKHFVVDIDFDAMMITLIEPGKFEYRGQGVAVPLKPMKIGPSAIPGRLATADGRSLGLDFMLDLGYNDQLQIASGGDHRIPVPEPALPASLGMNIQRQATMGHIGRVGRVELGGHIVKDVIAGFVSEAQSDQTYSEVMIGLGLLSRFNFVYDYPHRRLFLEPNEAFAEPFEYNMSGLTMRQGRGGYLEVVGVFPDSPASAAGIEVGDHIVTINDRPATDYDVFELRPLLRRAGKTVSMTVSRDGKKSEILLTLRRLI